MKESNTKENHLIPYVDRLEQEFSHLFNYTDLLEENFDS